MKLEEFIKKSRKDHIKIGCKGGSFFFYCGIQDMTLIKEALNESDQKAERMRQKLTEELERIKSRAMMIEYELSLPSKLADREVVEDYPSIANKDEVIVSLDGIRNGDYWDDEEYANRKKRKKTGKEKKNEEEQG